MSVRDPPISWNEINLKAFRYLNHQFGLFNHDRFSFCSGRFPKSWKFESRTKTPMLKVLCRVSWDTENTSPSMACWNFFCWSSHFPFHHNIWTRNYGWNLAVASSKSTLSYDLRDKIHHFQWKIDFGGSAHLFFQGFPGISPPSSHRTENGRMRTGELALRRGQTTCAGLAPTLNSWVGYHEGQFQGPLVNEWWLIFPTVFTRVLAWPNVFIFETNLHLCQFRADPYA